MKRSTRLYFFFALGVLLLQFVIFKWLYPFPSFFPDSYTYVSSAMELDWVSYRPIGYSWFLAGVHLLTTSATALVFLQYLLLQTAAFWLFISIRSLYRITGPVSQLVFIGLLCNPVTLFLANTISSDALFTSLALCWFVEMMWLIERPSWWRVAVQMLVLLLAVYVRFSALCYPLIALVAFLLCRRSWGYKMAGVAGCLLTVVFAVKMNEYAVFKKTHAKTFSGFSGWQMGNNALHIYPYIDVDSNALPTRETKDLDRFVRRYFAPIRDSLSRIPVTTASTEYMWEPQMPLKQYMTWRRDHEKADYFDMWCRVGVVSGEYGNWLVRRHPLLYARHYLLSSTASYLFPPLETLSKYNEGSTKIDPIAQKWFKYPTVDVKGAAGQARLLRVIPWLYLSLHLLFAAAFILFLAPGWRREHPVFFRGLLLAGSYLVVNAGFNIYATAGVMRYHIITLILLWAFTIPAFFFRFRRAPRV